jgi:hypothetical protein
VTSQPARHGSYNHSRRLCVLDGRSLRLDPPSVTAMTIVGAVTRARLCRRGFEYRSDLTPRVLQLYEKTRQVFTQQLERRPHGSAA